MEGRNEGMAENEKPENCEHIPDEIKEEFLVLLPVKPLLRFRAVCKAWKILIDSDSFKFKHLKGASKNSVSALLFCHEVRENNGAAASDSYTKKYKSSLHFLSTHLHELLPPPNDLDYYFGDCIVMNPKSFGFVNGLALVCWDYAPFVWNPLTNLVRKIDPRTCTIDKKFIMDYHSVIALGFDPNTKDYKVLFAKFSNVSKNLRLCEVHFRLYSLSSNSWKTWSCVRPRVGFVSVSDDGFLDGKSYWTAKECVQEDGSTVPGVLVFDFCDESFEIMPFFGKVSAAKDFVAVTTRGCLEIVVSFGEHDEEKSGEIWGMEEDGSWSRKVQVAMSSRVGEPLGIIKDGHMVFVSSEPRGVLYHDILLINPLSGSCKNLGLRSYKSSFSTYVESLFLMQ